MKEPEVEPWSNEIDLGGNGYTNEQIVIALGLLREGRLKARRLEAASDMTFRQARRLWKWFDSGAAGWETTYTISSLPDPASAGSSVRRPTGLA